jgi:hypothetical protein
MIYGRGYRFDHNGWIYLHVEGEPYDRGFQHGYLARRNCKGPWEAWTISPNCRADAPGFIHGDESRRIPFRFPPRGGGGLRPPSPVRGRFRARVEHTQASLLANVGKVFYARRTAR